MKTLNKKILIMSILGLIILLVLLFPEVDVLNDGGTKIYKSCIYEITKVHKLKENSLNEFYEGTIVKILGNEVYNNLTKDVKVIVDGKEPVTKGKKYEKNIDNITLSLFIPDDWKYKELERNTENDFYKYALKIYKDNEDNYAVLYYYQQMFGVCGTGRTSEQIELENGIKATIGYYYEKDIWEDISFYETNKYIAIINYGLDKAESEEVINLIQTINIMENSNKKENMDRDEISESGVNENLTLETSFDGKAEESDSPQISSSSISVLDYSTISLVIEEKTISSKGATFILKNYTDKEYWYGPDYYIEYKENGNWKELDTITGEPLTWNSIAYTLKPGEEKKLIIDWSYGYGELKNGEYRLAKKTFKEEDRPIDDSKTVYVYAPFIIK